MSLLDSYTYQVGVEWQGNRNARMSADSLPDLLVSAPPEFSGEPGRWTPEHLLAASTAACLMTTFLAIAATSKLMVFSFKSQAMGLLEKIPGEGYRFTKIRLTPEIGVADEDIEKAQKLLARAEKHCFISNSLRAAVQVEPRFVSQPVGAAR